MSINILRIPPRRPPPTASNVDLDMPQIMTINQPGAPSSEPDFEEEYVSDDEEVDEIIDDEPPPARKPNGKGKAKATPNNLTPGTTPGPIADPSPPKPKAEKLVPPLPPRKPGETHVDQQRVEKIIKAHGEMLPPSRDAVFLISLAAEEFVKRLASTGHRHASNEHRESIVQRDMALVARLDRGYSFLQETVPTAIPLSTALQKRAQKENERTLIATELTHAPPTVGNGTSTHSHKKRQPPLPKPQPVPKAKTRTSARQANGRSSTANNNSNASAGSSAAGTPTASSPRPRRAAAQRGRGSWALADDEAVEYEDEEPNFPPPVPMEVDEPPVQWRRQSFGSGSAGRGGIMKGFGPGAYGKVGGLAGRGDSGSPPRSRGSWGFPPDPPRNTGRTIYSDRTDEDARKAALEAEEQLRYKRARQKIEQELRLTQEAPEPSPGWTSDHETKEE